MLVVLSLMASAGCGRTEFDAGKTPDVTPSACVTVSPSPSISSTYAPTPSPKPTLSPLGEERLSYFREVALASEFGGDDRQGMVIRWERPIRILVSGDYTDADLQVVKEHVALLNLVEGVPEISLVESGENVVMRFLPQEELDSWSGLEESAWGFATVWYLTDGQITEAKVGIVSDEQTAAQRRHAILEELTQMLGILNDSPLYEDSIFQLEYSEVEELSEMDWWMVRMLYSPVLQSGMKGEAVLEACREWLVGK